MTNRVKMLCLAGACVLSLALTSAPARADVVISNGSLVITVHSSNGTFSAVFPNVPLGTSNYYDPGTPVSNFGLQTGTNTGTFRFNELFGGAGIPVTVTPSTGTASSVTVAGTYTAGGANVALNRVYTIAPGANDLITTNTFTNNGTSAITLRFFENNDPDQGIDRGNGFGTTNDVKTLGGVKVTEATETGGLSVVMGGLDAAAIAGIGPYGFSPLNITNGTDLNTFFTGQNDPNGAFADLGAAVGREFTLNPGQSFTFTVDQGFGTSTAAAEAAFLASQALVAIPEPSSMMVFGLLTAAGLGYYRRRRAAA